MLLTILPLFFASRTVAQELPYNQAQFKASHNSYAKDIDWLDKLRI
jgi:hypothetical protein